MYMNEAGFVLDEEKIAEEIDFLTSEFEEVDLLPESPEKLSDFPISTFYDRDRRVMAMTQEQLDSLDTNRVYIGFYTSEITGEQVARCYVFVRGFWHRVWFSDRNSFWNSKEGKE